MSIHATSTKVYSGAQMLTKNGMATPSTDTSFWASFTKLTQVDSGNGWATLTRSITSVFSNIQTTTDSVALVGNSTYTAIVEIQNCSIASGILVFAQTTAAQDPVSAYTVVSGCNSITGSIMGVAISGSSTPRYNVYVFSTKSSFQRGLRYYFHPDTGAGNIDIRATVLAGDHSSDWQDYCGDNYEPYVGGAPSPLVKGVAHVSTSKNLLNMQSNSNGEYFGTMSQGGYSVKNLYIGSPSFDGYGSVSSWEDGGIFNGMPVIKRAGSWTGAFKLVDVIAGKTYTFSTWMKSDQARPVAIYATGGSTGATATITPGSDPFTSSTSWERVTFTFTCDTSGTVALRVENRDSSETNYTYISGYQLELGSEATSYERYIGDGIYSGKNLMIYPYSARAPFNNGITFTSNSDGTVVLNGQNNDAGNSAFFFYSSSPGAFTLPAGTYYFLKPSDTSVQFVAYDGTTYWNFNAGNNYSRTFNSSMTFQDIYAQVPRGNTTVFNNLKIYPMLSTLPNQTQDDYEPYVGGVPSPNPDYPQEIVTGKIASKNLCPDTTEGYYITSTATGWGKTAVDSGVLIAVEPNTNYTISTTAAQSRYRFCFVASLDNHTGYNGGANDGGSNTYTKNSGSYPYLIVNATDLSKIQVEKGSTATEFEPYFTPIELAQMSSYQDRVYKSGDDWYIEKPINGMKLDSSTNFSLYTGASDTGFTFFKAAVATPRGQQCVSNYFTTSYTGWSDLQNQHIEMLQVYTNDSLYLKTKTSRISSAEALNTWLSNRDVRAYYILATPTNTAITDSATILWLNKYDTDLSPHHKYVNTRRTTYVGASGLTSAIDLYDGSYASTLPTYSTANDHHLTTANGGTYTVSLQNISAKIVSGTVTFSVFTNQRKIDFSWNGSATSTNVSVSLQADEYIKSIYAYIPQDADAGITLSQQLESGSLTDFEPYYNIVKIYAGDDLVFEDTSLTD